MGVYLYMHNKYTQYIICWCQHETLAYCPPTCYARRPGKTWFSRWSEWQQINSLPLGAAFGALKAHKQCFKTLRGRLYRRRYQLVFFKTSAKDIKNTPSILVVQISVIHQLKLWSVYFFCVHSRIQQNFVVLEKKQTNRMCSLSSPSPRAALRNTSLKWTVTQRKLNTRTWELYL